MALTEQLSFSIVDTQMTIKAMRDSGYKSTTHALAELVDNSIESGATSIEIFGISRLDDKTKRITLKELAVLDNGSGMDSHTLRGSLRYGHGTRRQRHGIGRFGLGLPNSSMSQARKVDVWSWQNGVTNALHTWLSLDDVEKGITEIPKPILQKVPELFLRTSQNMVGDSGTLVVWSDLDRVEWKQASTTFKHVEFFIGRIYRRFLAVPSESLHENDVRKNEIGKSRIIQFIPVEETGGKVIVKESDITRVRPNDPLYLMSGTSCPEEFGEGPMFMELTGSPFEVKISGHTIKVRASYARPHVRDSENNDASWPEKWQGRDAGNTPWGKHASNNMGISLMRAHREIQLDDSWIKGDDPRERWWTVEVDFPTELDELFGVTHNKQGAITFQRLARFDWELEALPGEETSGDVRRRMEAENDPRVYLYDLQNQIQKALKVIRPKIQEARIRRKRHGSTSANDAEKIATTAIKQRIEEGYKGKSDEAGKIGNEEERQEKQIESLTLIHHFDSDDARRQISETIRAGLNARLIQSSQPSTPAFFTVEPLPNVLQVALNTSHPVYSHLYDVIHRQDFQELSNNDLIYYLENAAIAFEILLFSWARYEDEQIERDKRMVRDVRIEWGKYAEEFFDDDDGLIAPSNFS